MLQIEIQKLAIGDRVLATHTTYAIERGSTHLLRGPNGCGKSLLIDAVCGVHRTRFVDVVIGGLQIGRGAHRRWRAGLRRQAQAPVLSRELVLEDVLDRAFADDRVPQSWRQRCLDILGSAGIDAGRAVGTHSFGQQRLLELVFACASGDWHLLDEPFAGIASAHVGAVASLIDAARAEERGVLLVDHTGVVIPGATIHDWPSPNVGSALPGTAEWSVGGSRRLDHSTGWQVRKIAIGKRTFLRDAAISAAPGHLTILRGSNGTGKSTILRSLARQRHPFPVDESIAGGPGAVFLSPQPPKLIGELTVRANLELMAENDRAMVTFAADALQHFGLSARLLPARAEALSGGEAAIVALVGAVASRAPVLLLDEPIESFSPSAVSAGVGLLTAALQAGRSIVAATHTERLIRAIPTATVIDLAA